MDTATITPTDLGSLAVKPMASVGLAADLGSLAVRHTASVGLARTPTDLGSLAVRHTASVGHCTAWHCFVLHYTAWYGIEEHLYYCSTTAALLPYYCSTSAALLRYYGCTAARLVPRQDSRSLMTKPRDLAAFAVLPAD
jgi:hypothetical protein